MRSAIVQFCTVYNMKLYGHGIILIRQDWYNIVIKSKRKSKWRVSHGKDKKIPEGGCCCFDARGIRSYFYDQICLVTAQHNGNGGT